MKNYVVVTDSCSDLSIDLREKYNIDYIPMHIMINGKSYDADIDFKEIPYKEFFDIIRSGTRITTAQITVQEYKERFESYINDGYDIMYISTPVVMSASHNASLKARDELLEKYPDSKIYCIDGLNACFGLGILVMTAAELRNNGMDIDELAKWVVDNRLTVNQAFTVENLTYLKRSGRISAVKAFFGGLLNKKPIIISDATGQNLAVTTVKGRRASMEKMAEMMYENFVDVPYQKVVVCHADDEESAKEFKKVIEEKFGDKKLDIYMGRIGPIIGSSTGPGSVAVLYFGKEVTINKPE
ncbi:MAG: DegV family protein [Clostridia bacterium]|nr:DegV family protein [Clostridia bacterium]